MLSSNEFNKGFLSSIAQAELIYFTCKPVFITVTSNVAINTCRGSGVYHILMVRIHAFQLFNQRALALQEVLLMIFLSHCKRSERLHLGFHCPACHFLKGGSGSLCLEALFLVVVEDSVQVLP